MLCEYNLFCSSLAPETRDELCRHCGKRTVTAGSMLLTEDASLKTNLILSGAMVTNTDFDSNIIQEQYDIPSFFLLTQGVLFHTEAAFMRKIPDQFSYNTLLCLTDCIIARFDHDVILGMFNSDPAFARSVLLNSITASSQACMFAATLRSYDVYQSVKWLLYFLSDKGVVLTHQQIANITTHNRTSVTKAIGAIKKREPELWSRYSSATEQQQNLYAIENQPTAKGKLPLLKKVLNYLSDIDIQTHPERCMHIRNRGITCNVCKSVCPGDAISIADFSITINPDRCLLCGACVSSCPYDAFEANNPTAHALIEQVSESAELTEGSPIVVCGHTHTDLMGTYAPHVVRINCLGRLDEEFYASLLEMDIESVTLVHGSCRECPRSTSGAQARRCFQAAQSLLFSWEAALTMRFTDKMPTEAYALANGSRGAKKPKQRTAPKSTRPKAAILASQEVSTTTHPGGEIPQTDRERALSVVSKIRAIDGTLPYHPYPRPIRVYDKLRPLACIPSEAPSIRFWGIPSFDASLCRQCGLCAVFCQSGAIKKIERFNYRKKKMLFAFEIDPFRCTRCSSCEQVCPNDAVKIKPLTSIEGTGERQFTVIYERAE